MRNPLDARSSAVQLANAPQSYDDGRRAACRSLVEGPVRRGAARRLVELALAPRDHRGELGEIFEQIDQVAARPRLPELTAVAARAMAAHTCRGTRSLGVSVAAVSAGIDRRFAACESGQAAYPLTLAGLGSAGRYGLEHNLSPAYLTHALERIVESAVFVGTVIDPACAPGAYKVRFRPRAATTETLGALLADHLACEQNTTIDFAFEELTSGYWRKPAVTDHLESVLVAVGGPIDIQRLVVGAHALVGSACDDVEIDAELTGAAGVLDGSGLSGEGSLALGRAVSAITGLAAGLVSSLFAAGRGGARGGGGAGVGGGAGGPGPAGGPGGAGGGGGGGGAASGARAVLRMALVVAWCAEHGSIRPGTITIEPCRERGHR